jgi:hypothetical protein
MIHEPSPTQFEIESCKKVLTLLKGIHSRTEVVMSLVENLLIDGLERQSLTRGLHAHESNGRDKP